jgi:transcriptional regulator
VQIEVLSAKFEDRLAPKPPWKSSKMTAGRLDAMKKAIVGLVMNVGDVEGSFKLNQHKSEADYAAISNALGSQTDAGSLQIAGLMRETRPQAFATEMVQNKEAAPLERTTP